MSSWQDPHQPCAYPLCVELAPGHLSLPEYSAGASGHNRVAPDLNVVLQTAALKLPDLLQEQTSRLSSGHSPRECPHSGGDQLEVTCCRLLGECLPCKWTCVDRRMLCSGTSDAPFVFHFPVTRGLRPRLEARTTLSLTPQRSDVYSGGEGSGLGNVCRHFWLS